uniref:RdRp n=1 Tax=Hubei picobirna-like virus 4 TaxID=1923087 RepID=A0A1L3KLP5_9VIRU|nr:RdRp [Hubei picobirna-like virus 4]
MHISKVSQTELERILDKDKIQVVSDSLETLRLGRPPTPRTPLFKDKSENEVFSDWLTVLNRQDPKFKELVDYDISRLEKTGPQGGYPPLSERMEELEAYYKNPRELKISDEEYDRSVIRLRTFLFGSEKDKRPMTYESIVNRDVDEEKLNTNSGCPLYGKRSDPFIQKNAIALAKSGMWKTLPAILGSRSQRGKWRFIYMFPYAVNLVEKSFLLPLMDIIRKRNILSFSAWEGFEDVEMAMHKQNFFKAQTIVSMDYKKMDTHCGEAFMNFVYDVIAPVFQASYRPLLKESLFYACNIEVLIGIDKKVTGVHGLASGSGWTNFTESVFSQGIRFAIQDKLGLPLIGDQGLGDDGALSFGPVINDVADVIVDTAAERGQDAEPSKQRVDNNTCVYLQRFFKSDIMIEGTNVVAGSYPSILALNTAMNPERFHDPRKWNESMEILRWIMILENCNHSPYFKQLIEYFIEGDKFKLGIEIPGFFNRGIVSAYKEAKLIKGFVPSYNQSSIDRGILDFEVVKYLKARGR